MVMLKGRIEQIEHKIENGLPDQSPSFDCERSVIVINLAQHDQENVAEMCNELFREVLGVECSVTRAVRTRQRDPKRPPVVKCQLATL